MATIYCIGETVYDIIFKNSQPIAAKAGGSMLNSSVSMGRAGLPVHFISEFGSDALGNDIDQFLQQNGVHTSYIYRYSDGKTSLAIATLDAQNNAAYSFYKHLPERRLDMHFPTVKAGDIVLFGSFYAINSDIRDKVAGFITQANRAGAMVLYDPNFRKAHLHELQHVMPMIVENMRLATIVRGSDEDFNMLFGAQTATEAYNIVKQHCTTLIYTAGAKGVDVITPHVRLHADVPAITTVSTIGAGDSFSAGCIYALYKAPPQHIKPEAYTADMWQVLLQWGIAFAADVCTHYDNYIAEPFAQKLT